MSGIFEKFERCVIIEDTEILTREDVKQQVKEFSFDLPFLLQPVSAILLAAENAAIGWNTGCFWSLCCSAHITKATLTCFVSLTVTLTHTQIRQPSHQLRGGEGALLLPEDEQVSHSQRTEEVSPSALVSVSPQIAGVQQHPVHTYQRDTTAYETAPSHCITLRVHAHVMLF